MKTTQIHKIGDLQLRILKVLWARRRATVSEVHESLNQESDFAYTTIATMLRKMEERGLVTHDAAGRSFIYQPLVSADAVTRGLANHLLERLFEGNLAGMVSHLLTSREVSPEELREIEKLIAERKRKKS